MEQFGAIGRDEDDSLYKDVEAANARRHLGFLNSMINAANETGHIQLTHALIKAINFHAIAGLHREAGIYRLGPVTVGNLALPNYTEVPFLMGEFIRLTNDIWAPETSFKAAAYALWRLNHIHPFVNGNGRTARALCYYIISTSLGYLPPGKPTLPEQFTLHREEYIEKLRIADAGDLNPLIQLTARLFVTQVTASGQ